MEPDGRYVYGIIRTNEDREFGLIGIGGARVYTLGYRNIAAVISDHPVTKLLPLRQYLAPHHQVIRTIAQQLTIVPMTFGHITKEDDVRRMLKKNFTAINDELIRLDNKVEMGLKIVWDVDNIFDYFVRQDRELALARDQVFGRSLPPTQMEKIELGKIFEAKVNHERERHAERVTDILRDCAAEVKINPPAEEKVVLHAVFLVERNKQKEFEAAIYQAANLFDGNYSFDYSGPWAPYTFVELELET
jgi:hypothetical protein